MITIAKETLDFRHAGISPALRLLVPTFLLLNAPVSLAGWPSQQLKILSYQFRQTAEVLTFGISLSPVHLRRKIS